MNQTTEDKKYRKVHQDEHGAGVLCKKCDKIMYIAIFNEYPLGDSYSSDGSSYEHLDCNDTLTISKKFTLVEHLPDYIHGKIEALEKEKTRLEIDPSLSEIAKLIEVDKFKGIIFTLQALIPKDKDGKIAKSCRVEEKIKNGQG